MFKNILIKNKVLLYSGDLSNSQEELLRTGANVVVSTPGRLYEMIQNNYIKMSDVKCVVIDEVDAMLMRNFTGKLNNILCEINLKSCQICLFSASMPEEISCLIEQKFSKEFIQNLVLCDLVTTKKSSGAFVKNHLLNYKNSNEIMTTSVIDNDKMEHCLYKVESSDLNERIRSAVHVIHTFSSSFTGMGNVKKNIKIQTSNSIYRSTSGGTER